MPELHLQPAFPGDVRLVNLVFPRREQWLQQRAQPDGDKSTGAAPEVD